MILPQCCQFPTHMSYADDVLLFGRGNVRNLKAIVEAFNLYSWLSGQLVN